MGTTEWYAMGEYFENCNCEVVCPCLISSQPMNTVWPTYTHCDLALAFHVEKGHYGDTDLAGLTAVVMAYTPGKMIQQHKSHIMPGGFIFIARIAQADDEAHDRMFPLQ